MKEHILIWQHKFTKKIFKNKFSWWIQMQDFIKITAPYNTPLYHFEIKYNNG